MLVQVEAALAEAGMQSNVPVLILSECVLVYLRPEDSNAVIQHFGSYFASAAVVVRVLILAHFCFHCKAMTASTSMQNRVAQCANK